MVNIVFRIPHINQVVFNEQDCQKCARQMAKPGRGSGFGHLTDMTAILAARHSLPCLPDLAEAGLSGPPAFVSASQA